MHYRFNVFLSPDGGQTMLFNTLYGSIVVLEAMEFTDPPRS